MYNLCLRRQVLYKKGKLGPAHTSRAAASVSHPRAGRRPQRARRARARCRQRRNRLKGQKEIMAVTYPYRVSFVSVSKISNSAYPFRISTYMSWYERVFIFCFVTELCLHILVRMCISIQLRVRYIRDTDTSIQVDCFSDLCYDTWYDAHSNNTNTT